MVYFMISTYLEFYIDISLLLLFPGAFLLCGIINLSSFYWQDYLWKYFGIRD